MKQVAVVLILLVLAYTLGFIAWRSFSTVDHDQTLTSFDERSLHGPLLAWLWRPLLLMDEVWTGRAWIIHIYRARPSQEMIESNERRRQELLEEMAEDP